MLWIWSGAEPVWRQAAVEGTVWNWTLHEASVLSWASCAPWEEGAAAFHTLPHIHCLYSIACVCICVFFNVCVQFLWLKKVFFTLRNFLSNFRMTWESLSSKCIIQIYNDECTQAWLNFGFIYSAVASVRLISFDIAGLTCLHCLTQNVSVICHSSKVMHGHLCLQGMPGFIYREQKREREQRTFTVKVSL